MIRKVIQQGPATLMVSLPTKWVKKRGIKKGDEVNVEEENKRLVINIQKSDKFIDRKSIDISGMYDFIPKLIGCLYKKGYNEVEVHFDNAEELKSCQNIIRLLFVGFEIVEQGKSHIIISHLSKENFDDFNRVLKRFLFLLNFIASDFYEASKERDYEWLKTNALRDYELDKFADFCRRAINKDMVNTYNKTAPLYTMIEELEKVSDIYRDLCLYNSKNKIVLSKSELAFIKEVNKFVSDFIDFFNNFDIKKLKDLTESKSNLKKEAQRLKNTDFQILHSLLMIVERVYDINGPILATNI